MSKSNRIAAAGFAPIVVMGASSDVSSIRVPDIIPSEIEISTSAVPAGAATIVTPGVSVSKVSPCFRRLRSRKPAPAGSTVKRTKRASTGATSAKLNIRIPPDFMVYKNKQKSCLLSIPPSGHFRGYVEKTTLHPYEIICTAWREKCRKWHKVCF